MKRLAWGARVEDHCSPEHRNKMRLALIQRELWLQPRLLLLLTCFVLQNEVKFIRLLEGFRWNQNLLVQHLMKFGTNRATQQHL